jgi:hypothetical protein
MQLKQLKLDLKVEQTTGKKSLEAAQKENSELKRAMHAGLATQENTTGGLNKRMQVLKHQKEATQHRAEVAESKLLTVSNRLAEMTKATSALEKEKVILEKTIVRLEKKQVRAEGKVEEPPSSPSPVKKSSSSSGDKQSKDKKAKMREGVGEQTGQEKDGDEGAAVTPSSVPRDLALSLTVAVCFLYLGTVIGPVT